VTFSPQPETGSGPLQQRPLALAEMDGHVYCAAGKFLLKRTKAGVKTEKSYKKQRKIRFS